MRAQEKALGEEETRIQKDLPVDRTFEPGFDSGVGYDKGERKKKNSNF